MVSSEKTKKWRLWNLYLSQAVQSYKIFMVTPKSIIDWWMQMLMNATWCWCSFWFICGSWIVADSGFFSLSWRGGYADYADYTADSVDVVVDSSSEVADSLNDPRGRHGRTKLHTTGTKPCVHTGNLLLRRKRWNSNKRKLKLRLCSCEVCHSNRFLLAQSMCPIFCLAVILRIPWQVLDSARMGWNDWGTGWLEQKRR